MTSRLFFVAGTAALVAFATAAPVAAAGPAEPTTPIEHFVFLMQGDRSFDNFFGTFPGADGIPAATCQELVIGEPDAGCVTPFLLDKDEPASLSAGPNLIDRQWNNGAMDRFVAAFRSQGRDGTKAMGHYDAAALPFYWSVAQNYVLFDKFFSASRLGEAANRNYWVSGAPRSVPEQRPAPRAGTTSRRSSTGCRMRASAGSFTSRTTGRSRRTAPQRSPTPARNRLEYRC